MTLTVKQRGQHVATFRSIEVRLMEILSAWVPSTPEMEAKLLFGPHVWDLAQAADALGKRTYELRLPLQHSIAPGPGYLDLLEHLSSMRGAAQRIAAFYDVMLPALAARYRRYLEQTDPLMDAPSVRVMENIIGIIDRMVHEADVLRRALPALRLDDRASLRRLASLEASVFDVVAQDAPADAARQAA